MAYKSQAIILLTLGWFLGVATVVGMIMMKQKEPVQAEPVVCVVKLKSGPVVTHNLKGVVK